MSFIFGRKDKEKESKYKFYVEFLGWIECRGLRGRRITDPVIQDLRRKQRKWKNAPKLTLQVSKSEMKISQDIEEKKRKIKTIKFPVIPSRDITYATQAVNPRDGRPDDIVACIYLGYVPRTQKYVHVHVYRFDTPETATKFVRFVNSVISAFAERTRQIEIDFANQEFIDDPRLSSSDGMSDPHTSDSAADSAHSTYSGSSDRDTLPSDEIEPDLQSLHDVMAFDSVTDELKRKLGQTMVGDAPILLPPKDYDTVSRRQGNLNNINLRKSLNLNIVGFGEKQRNTSAESGVDLASPSEGSEGKGSSLNSPSPSEDSITKSPPLSSRSERDFVYPPMSARSNRSSQELNDSQRRHVPNRQASFNSAYSNNSFRSGESSNSNGVSDHPSGHPGSYNVVYRGGSEIPPVDYDGENEPVILRKNANNNNNNRWGSQEIGSPRSPRNSGGYGSPRSPRNSAGFAKDVGGLRRNLSGHLRIDEDEAPMYASVNKQRSKSTRDAPHISDYYSQPAADYDMRRTNSMYK